MFYDIITNVLELMVVYKELETVFVICTKCTLVRKCKTLVS
ncbi:hypothetical protein DYY67_0001 [Candidatus Nitrosotalea sp. TS]|nr:hypothetical protein [Candidatus Nitrosotalea sp. TS]